MKKYTFLNRVRRIFIELLYLKCTDDTYTVKRGYNNFYSKAYQGLEHYFQCSTKWKRLRNAGSQRLLRNMLNFFFIIILFFFFTLLKQNSFFMFAVSRITNQLLSVVIVRILKALALYLNISECVMSEHQRVHYHILCG